MVAGDEWGQIVILHFQVYNNVSTVTTQLLISTISFPVSLSSATTESLAINIWTNNTSPNVISNIKVLTNASQIPHIIQFNVTKPSYIFLTEPYGVYNNGSSYSVVYANNGTSVPLIANIKAEYFYSAQPITGLIQIKFIGPGEY